MSLLDKASLVLTPNAYKENKLYSVIPSSGLGDMTVTRSTTATRVNEAGFIEETPYNLLTYSENLNEVSWYKSNVNIINNAGISPDGLNNATKVVNISNGFLSKGYNPSIVLGHSRSIWAKTTSGTGSVSLCSHNGNANALFNITNEWQRFELNTYNSTGANSFYAVDFRSAGSTLSEILLWGGQAEVGSVAKPYFPTTDRLNIPQIDYTDGCPSILIEPQRTNLFSYSEQFDNGAWTKDGVSASTENFTNPRGEALSYFLKEGSTNGAHQIYTANTIVAGSINTISFLLKRKVGSADRFLRVQSTDGSFSNGARVIFDIQNMIISTSVASLGTGSNVSASIESFGADGWFKVSLTCKIDEVSTVFRNNNYLQNQGSLFSAGYQGDGTSGVYIFGAQLEQGSYPTSYIPTVASIVTRNVTTVSKTGISDLIGQTEGVLFVESASLVSLDSTNARLITLSNGNTNNRIQIQYTTSNNTILLAIQSNGGTSQFQLTSSYTTTNLNKIAVRYKVNDFSLWVNGTKIFTIINQAMPIDLSKLSFDRGDTTSSFYGKTKHVQLYKTYLTDTELIALTTI
tara:strand:+ start:819 stop:2540 length:1722 start_codon:yes stop_codon:yes gene_type:complete